MDHLSCRVDVWARVDLEYSTFSGEKPFLFNESSGAVQNVRLAAGVYLPMKNTSPGGRLEAVLRDTQALVMAINIAVDTKTKLQPSFFQESMVTTQYRIFFLEFSEDEWEKEALRLGMVAFGATVYFRFAGYRREYGRLGESLAEIVERHLPAEWPRPELLFWLLIVGSISVWKAGSQSFVLDTLRDLAYQLRIRTWTDAKAVLKSILWVDALHDELAGEEFRGTDMPFRLS